MCLSVCLSAIITQERHIRFWWSLVRWIENKKIKFYLLFFENRYRSIYWLSILSIFRKTIEYRHVIVAYVSESFLGSEAESAVFFRFDLTGFEKCSNFLNFRNWVCGTCFEVKSGVLRTIPGLFCRLDVTLTWKKIEMVKNWKFRAWWAVHLRARRALQLRWAKLALRAGLVYCYRRSIMPSGVEERWKRVK